MKETYVDDYKALLQSKTVWSNLIGLVALLLAMFGYNITPEDQIALTSHVLEFIVLATQVLSIHYRIKATKKIG